MNTWIPKQVKKVALIWPGGFDKSYVLPLSLGYLKANLSSDYEVKIIDLALTEISHTSEEFRNILSEFNPDIVGVSTWAPTYLETLAIFQTAKIVNPNIVTVIGGAHATSYPDKIMLNHEIDFLFLGEAELSFPVFLKELTKAEPNWKSVRGLCYRDDKGVLLKNEMDQRPEVMDDIRFPDYDAINLEGYLSGGYRFLDTLHRRNAPIWLTRGCPYRCGFCSAPLQNGKRVRTHSIDYVLKWIKYLYFEKGIRVINIVDDNFTFHVDYAKEFCEAMIQLNLKDLNFGTPNGIRSERTDFALLKLMRQAGWRYLTVAPESGSPRTLKRMQKDLDLNAMKNKIREIRKAGIKVHAFFIIGYPDETPEDLQLTEEFICDSEFDMFFISNFQPLPGTPIYDELVAKGEIQDGLLPKNYSEGERVYVPATLKDFNFSKYVLRNYLNWIRRDPRHAFYMVNLIGMDRFRRKCLGQLRGLFHKPNDRTPRISPEDIGVWIHQQV